MDKKYPEHILIYLRQREGLDKYDTSMDVELNALPPSVAFAEVCKWNGFLGGWNDTFKMWIKDIYGFDIDEI